MPEITLVAEVGRPIGSRAANRLRASGKIPGVVYGHGADPLPIAVEGRALRAALSGEAGLNALLNLEMDGKTQLAMAKDIQRHPVRGTVSHVDFLAVSRDEVITADVPVQLIGEATAVLKADGVVDHELFSLTVHAKPGNLPNQIEIDITDMEIGDAIRVDDIELPAGVTTDIDGETVVVIAQPPRVEVVEGEEAAEGEAASPEAAAEAAEQAGAEPPAEPQPAGGDAE
jgi:large subunit ribosomal protein L25